MNRPTLVGSHENIAKPWNPSSPKEAVLDVLTLGLTRQRREQRIRAHYADMDEYRLVHNDSQHEVTPSLLSNVVPGAEAIARLALNVVSNAKAMHIAIYQGYEATLTRDADGKQQASSTFAYSYLHEPTLHRMSLATGRNYARDLGNTGILTVLRSRGTYVNIEGIGQMANEYRSPTSKPGRVTAATFVIQGLPNVIAGEFIDSLREQPVEMLDGVVYTAFAGDTELPGRSLLQASDDRQADSLFVPGACTGVRVAAMPKQ